MGEQLRQLRLGAVDPEPPLQAAQLFAAEAGRVGMILPLQPEQRWPGGRGRAGRVPVLKAQASQ